MNERTIAERIQQRRLQMLVHSYLYYELDINIITDAQWSKWAKELAELQLEYPDIAEEVQYSVMFKDWDGSTGAHLVYDDQIKKKANYLLRNKNETSHKMVQPAAGKTSSEVGKRKTDGKLRCNRLF